jgi:hypothetical protein
MPLWLFNNRPQSITWEKSTRAGHRNKPTRQQGGGSEGQE